MCSLPKVARTFGRVHPMAEKLKYMCGTWQGDGSGFYPTIKPFTYSETTKIDSVPSKPILTYNQVTRNKKGEIAHCESGFIRIVEELDDDSHGVKAELVLADNTGYTSIYSGTSKRTDTGYKSFWSTVNVSKPPSNKKYVRQLTRELLFNDNQLNYTMRMATDQVTLQDHLIATLQLQESDKSLYKEVTVQETEQNQADYAVIDVREPDELESSGEMPHAANLPLGYVLGPNGRKDAYIQNLPKHRPVLVVCRAGIRARLAAEQIAGWGFGNVDVLKGGYIAWKKHQKR